MRQEPGQASSYRRSDSKEDLQRLRNTSRSPRIVKQDSAWYFNTREGMRVGPFGSEFDAELGASLLITRLAQLDANMCTSTEILHFRNQCSFIERAPSKPKLKPVTRRGESWIERIQTWLQPNSKLTQTRTS